jgi:hypothetical protein
MTTTMNVYIDQVDGGLGSADVWDEILGGVERGGGDNRGDNSPPETPANGAPLGMAETPSQSQNT